MFNGFLIMKIVTWNVNGIRAAHGKGFLNWLDDSDADVVFLQETKIQENQLPEELVSPGDYQSAWFSAERKGYSSVAAYFREKPDRIEKGMGAPEYDCEGRSITVFFGKLALIGAYFPNSQDLGARLSYKIGFNDAILAYCDKLRGAGYEIVLTGDYNVAHRPIDLARPDENEKNAGYLPEERAWMTKFLSSGYVDSFRHLHGDIPAQYSWWTFRANARARNVGWRIDYTNVSAGLTARLKACDIHPDVMGSDHCPVSLALAD
ncbi:exodeoxyribonuclease III [Oscillatoria laete-virens NRMC-F 0139]|nr:exodeoxyribonuclease III [Oscillatoria laete-virens]MDL5053131.1 exodeoxyribonuclease III [Oscillatoria laete-virens NRMC-F 0139]